MVTRRDFLSRGSASAAAIGLGVYPGTEPEPSPLPPSLRAQRLSWAGVKLEIESRTLLIDPWISPAIWDGAWTAPVVPIEISTRARNVLLTHLHNDHFDPAAVAAAIPEGGSVVCHAEIAAAIASRGHRTFPVQLYEPFPLGDFVVTAVPASDGLGERQVSWIVTGGGRRVIHCGDTIWHGALHRIGKAYGPFDAAFLPINGAQVLALTPRSGLPMSFPPEHAVAAAVVLGARLLVPIHYGLHDPKAYLEHPDAEGELIRAARRREVAVELVAPGGWLTWSAGR